MLVPLFLLLLLVPVVELFVLIQVGREIGVLATLGALVLMGLLGAWLAKRQGVSVVRRARRQVEAGRPPAREALDGVLILFAGGLLLLPGFVSDVLAIALLLPPVRAAVRGLVLARLLGPTGPLAGASGRELTPARVTRVRSRRRSGR